MTLENGTKTWVSFRYEQIPNLCYWCGCLDHDDKDCEVWVQSEGNMELSKKKFDSSIHVKPVYLSSKNVVHVPSYFEGMKKKLVKPSPMSNSRPLALVQKPVPWPSTPAPLEKESAYFGDNITIEFTNSSNIAYCDPVIGLVPANPDNGKEDFLEKIKEIDKDMERCELSENDVINSNYKSITPPPNGPNLNPTDPIIKPTRWTQVARPFTSQEKSLGLETLGKRSNSLPTEENPIQKSKTQDANLDCDYVSPTAVADIQPHREL